MKVVVTRPEQQASATLARLRALGHDVTDVPLTMTAAISPQPANLTGFRYVAITSANALRHAETALLEPVRRLPVFAVGERSAAFAREAGFKDVRSADGDAQALARLIVETIEPGSTLLYLCGRTRRPDFEEAMRHAGFPLHVVETYETRPVALGSGAAARFSTADAVLLFSQSAARAVSDAGIDISRTTFVCMSQRVAEALPPGSRIVVADRPTEDAMIAALDRV